MLVFKLISCFKSAVYCPLLTGYQNQSLLTKCYNCLELYRYIKWTIPHLLRQKVNYLCALSITSSTLFHFCFGLFTIFIYISYVFSRKIDNLHGFKLLSGIPLPFLGTLRIFSAQKCSQNLTFLSGVKWGIPHFAAF